MKGFGEIMAEVAMQRQKDGVKTNPRCPLCGEVMSPNGAGSWFCQLREEHTHWLEGKASAAYNYQRAGGIVFWCDLETPVRARWKNWDPEMQGVLLATTETGWVFSTTRGDFGRTYFRVSAPDETAQIPALEDWRWAEWTTK